MTAETSQPSVRNDESLLNDYSTFRAQDDAARTQAEPSAFDDFIARRRQTNKEVPVDPTEQLDTNVTGALDVGVESSPDSQNPEFVPATDTSYDMSNASAGVEAPKKEFTQDKLRKALGAEGIQGAQEGGFFKDSGAVLKDVGLGIVTLPVRAPEGIISGLKEIHDIMVKGTQLVSDPIMKALGQSDEDIAKGNKEQLEQFSVPDILKDTGKSVTGSLIKNISQFMTGFKGLDKVLKLPAIAAKIPAASRSGKFIENVSKAAVADMAVFNEQEERLSNLIESVPALKNPLTDFLQSDKEDSFLLGKLKQGLEGVVTGVVADGLIEVLSRYKALRSKTKEVSESLGFVEEEGKAALRDAREQEVLTARFNELGDISNDDLVFRKPQTKEEIRTQDKTKSSNKKTKDIDPLEVMDASHRPPQKEDEIVINYARISSGEDVKNVIQTLANDARFKGDIQQSRRGVVSDKQVRANASEIDAFDDLISRRVGDAFNAEEIYAARSLYQDTAEKLLIMAERAASPIASTADAFNFRRMMAVFDVVQQEVLGVRAEAGRALRAWSIPIQGQRINPGRMQEIMATFGGTEPSIELAKKITALGGDISGSKLAAVVRKSAYARTRDAMVEAWTMGLLTSPTTHVANTIGNTLTTVAEVPKRFMQALAKDSGVSIDEAFNLAYGMFTSFGEAMKNSAVAFRTNESIISKMDFPRQRATSTEALDASGVFTPLAYGMDLYGRFVGVAGRMLTACDEFGRTLLMNGEKYALATRDGIDKGLKGIELNQHIQDLVQNPTPYMIDKATDFSNYNLFINQLGETGLGFQKILAKHPTARFIFPFVKTPINIFKYAFEHSPLAPLSSRIRNDINGGGLKRAETLAKIGLGSAVLSISTDQALKGNITGNGPTDPKARKILLDSGWQPYSFRVGDKYLSYRRFEPIATWMSIAADMTEILSNYESYDIKQQDDIDSLVTAGIIALSEQVINKTFLSGFAGTMEMFADPKRQAPKYLERFASSFVPNIFGAARKIDDPGIKHVTTMIDAIKAKIPGLSNTVPDRRNVFGEVVEAYYPTVGNELADAGIRILMAMNPVYVSKVKEEPINRFLLNNGFCLDMPNKKIKYDGVYVDISDYPHIYNRYLEILGTYENPKYNGEKVKDFLNELVSGDTPQSFKIDPNVFNEDDIKSYVQKVYADYKAEAMKQIRDEFPVIDALVDDAKVRKEQSNEAVESGLRRPIP